MGHNHDGQDDTRSTHSVSSAQSIRNEIYLSTSSDSSTPPRCISPDPTRNFSPLLRQPSISSVSSSTASIQSSLVEEVKHEVMVNYLFQQQCSAMWIGDSSGQLEGIMLRKTRGLYLSCPPQLADTSFEAACIAMNVQVCNLHSDSSKSLEIKLKVSWYSR